MCISRIYKNVVTIVFVTLFLFYGLLVYTSPTSKSIYVNNGEMNLQQFDFEKYIVEIQGETYFYWQRLLTKDQLPKYQSVSEFISTTNSWNNQGSGYKNYPAKGYATYHLKIYLSEQEKGKQFIMRPYHFIAYASEIFVNGNKVAFNGSVGKSKSDLNYQPSRRTQSTIFTADTTVLDVIIHVSNFHHFRGGIFKELQFGHATDVTKKREKAITYDLFIIISLFIMFVYHFLFYFVNKREKTPLFFGIVCLVFAFDLSLQGPMCFFLFFPDSRFYVHSTIHLCMPFLIPSSFLFFLYSLFPEVVSKSVRNIVGIISVVLVGIVSLGITEINSVIVKPHFLYVFIIVLYVYYVAIKAIINKSLGAGLFLFAYTVFSLCAINDILNMFELLHTTNLVSTGLIVFVVLLSVIQGRKMSTMYSRIVHLSRHLKELNINLEKKVEERTNDLNRTLKRNLKLKQVKDDMTNMIIHDLKTPLNTLINVPDTYTSAEKDEIRQSTARKMLNMVLNILDVNKFEERGLQPQLEHIDIVEIWETVVHQLSYTIKSKNISIINKINIRCIVNADKNLLERIFTNLLTNALKFVEPNGIIKLDYQITNNETIKICVVDNGSGISPDKLLSIFNKYEQGVAGIKQSTGLGLTFCKLAVETLNGEISIFSKVEIGTEVCFTLPLVEIRQQIVIDEILQTPVTLSERDLKLLRPFYDEFVKIDISETTAFRKLFKKISALKPDNEEWLKKLQKAVYSQNQQQIDTLIQLIK